MESPRRECIPDQIFLLFQTANDIFEMAKSIGVAEIFFKLPNGRSGLDVFPFKQKATHFLILQTKLIRSFSSGIHAGRGSQRGSIRKYAVHTRQRSTHGVKKVLQTHKYVSK